MAEARVVLQTTGLARRFGGLRAVDGVDLRIREGRIHCIIGPNGAGKSTLFNLISGVLPPTAGRVAFEERDITRKSPQAIARLGLARSFQTPRVFASMPVLDHVLLASREHAHDCPLARDALTRVGLHEREQVLGENLAHGEKKRLELAMALAMRPRLVLLDEPTAGMNAHETDAVATIVREIAAAATVAIIEHDIDFVRGLADDVTVLHKGAVLREGTIAEIEGDDDRAARLPGRSLMALLEVEQLHAGYGRIPALFGVELSVAAGEIVALLGRNGVGKTTTLRSIVGLTTRKSGRVVLDGRSIERLPTHVIARLGVAYVPEDRGVFPGLSVRDNLRLGRLAGRGARKTRTVSRLAFPSWRSDSNRMPTPFPAGSGKCWLWSGRSWPSRGSSSWTSSRRDCSRIWCRSWQRNWETIAASGRGHSPGRAECPPGAAYKCALLCDGEGACGRCRGIVDISG